MQNIHQQPSQTLANSADAKLSCRIKARHFFSSRWSLVSLCIIVFCIAFLSAPTQQTAAQETKAAASGTKENKAAPKEQATGKVIDIKNVCVHVLKLEETLKLYKEILGFELVKEVTLHGEGIEGMLVREMKAGGCVIHLSLPAPKFSDTVGPIGNTNHNHFMLVVDNIVPICDKLKAEGYELENDEYARDKWSFFTGPNGEIVGLTEYR